LRTSESTLDADVVTAFLDPPDADHQRAIGVLGTHLVGGDGVLIAATAYAEVIARPLQYGTDARSTNSSQRWAHRWSLSTAAGSAHHPDRHPADRAGRDRGHHFISDDLGQWRARGTRATPSQTRQGERLTKQAPGPRRSHRPPPRSVDRAQMHIGSDSSPGSISTRVSYRITTGQPGARAGLRRLGRPDRLRYPAAILSHDPSLVARAAANISAALLYRSCRKREPRRPRRHARFPAKAVTPPHTPKRPDRRAASRTARCCFRGRREPRGRRAAANACGSTKAGLAARDPRDPVIRSCG
jgi:hypothetical protein